MSIRHHTWLGVLLLMAGCNAAETTTLTGYVDSEMVVIAAPQPGWLVDVAVREGDRIEDGQILFRLDSDQQELALAEAQARTGQASAQAEDTRTGARPAEIAALSAQLQQARARLDLAERELRRITPLAKAGTVPAAQLDQAQTERDAASAGVDAANEAIRVARLAAREGVQKASLAQLSATEAAAEQAAWMLDQRQVVSRMAGRVEQVARRKGEFVTAGATVLAVLPDDALKVRFFVPEPRLSGVKTGMDVTVHADGAAQPITAQVSYVAAQAEFTPPVIYSAASREKLVFAVEARLPPGTSLNPGLPVDIDLP